MNGCINDSAGFEFESGRPMNDAGSVDSSFELILFIESEGSVSGPGPAGGVSEEGGTVCGFDVEKWLASVVWTCAVVGHEEDEGVVHPRRHDRPRRSRDWPPPH